MINIKIDSRKIEPGDIFVAIPGSAVDGHNFVESAYKKGAKKAIVEHKVDCEIEQEIVENSSEWLTNYICDNYANELKEINMIGVTGTNGKTTTAYLTYQILNKLKSPTSYVGTIGFYLPSGDMIELPNTTPNILDLYELLLESKENGCKNIMMEVSSHSLHQKRVKGIVYKTAAFTNLTEDHLDYHKTMDNYLEAKKLILNQLEGSMIVNADDQSATSWIESYTNTKTFGYNGEYCKIIDYKDTEKGTLITFKCNNKEYQVETNLRSKFNVYNYLTSLCLINELGYSIEEIIAVTPSIYPPKGRCEQIKVGDAEAVIDYAHTPDAVEKIIEAFSVNKKGKVITIVGCGGDRDPIKRPIMGRIATEKSDYVIFTSDNPRTEDPNKILEDIIKGVSTKNYEIEIDRPTAIVKGLEKLEANDVLLILGKGHEDYQIIGREKHHLDDAEEVKKYISKKAL